MKRSLFPFVIILSLLFSLSGSIRPALAANPFPSIDFDQDSIPNSIETAGWYNLAGGPYVTNPNKADSDDDGLTDAEEKLFNTDPTDPHEPGIAVKYESAYKTFEYYNASDSRYLAMVQGGNQYLLTEGLVVRRGTTFKIAALTSPTATLSISSDGLTPLTATRDVARGGWIVSFPAGGKVGNYTATITDGGWHKDLPIYAIFELPTDMTQDQIDAYVYDDDPSNQRDEVAVWWRVRDYPYYFYNGEVTETPPGPNDCEVDSTGVCSNWQYHTNYGYAQAFWTEQFTKNVLLDFTLPVIQGETNQYDATLAIVVKADQSVRVNYDTTRNSFSSATHYDYISNPSDPHFQMYRMDGGACETNSGVLTSMLRSVGIPAQMFNLDYNKVTTGSPPYPHGEAGNTGIYEYDHAVRMWIDGGTGNQWYAERIAVGGEAEYQAEPIWTNGYTTGLRPLDEVGLYNPLDPSGGFGKFRDLYADLVQTVNENWDFQTDSLGGGMVNTVWPIPDAEFTNPANPSDPYLNRDYRWDSRRPTQMDYQSPYMDILNCQLWMGDAWAPSEWRDPAVPFPDPAANIDYYNYYYSDPAGRTTLQTYTLLGSKLPDATDPMENWLYNPFPNRCSPSSVGTADCTAFLASWLPVCTPLPGQTFASAPMPSIQSPAEQTTQTPGTAVNTLITLGKITGDEGYDVNGDGLYDELLINVNLDSLVAGEYQLGGWLKAGEKEFTAEVANLTLKQGTQTVQVAFDGQSLGDNGVNGPYRVEALWVAPAGQAVSQIVTPEELTALQTYTYDTQAYASGEFIVLAANIGSDFAYTTADKNGNGAIDAITIAVPLEIALPGTFSVQGDLVDGAGKFIGHASWTGSASNALLEYGIADSQAPYSLEHVNLVDAQGKLLDARYAPVYKTDDLIGPLDQASIVVASSPLEMSVQSMPAPSSFSLTPVDLNANGKYDQLDISTQVTIAVNGNYWMEGLLMDSYGIPAAWAVGIPQALTAGTRTLHLVFDAKLLYEHPFAGIQKFSLVAVKVFSGAPGTAALEASVPVTNFSTPNYTRTQLEPISPSLPFQDDMEGGTAKWDDTGTLTWSMVTSSWHSYSHAYAVSGSNAKSGSLALAGPLDLTGYVSPWLRFNLAYQLGAGDSLILQGSTDGTNWTPLKTYSGPASTTYWSSEIVDMSAYAEKAGVRFRFTGTLTSGHSWNIAIDDVFLHAAPAIKSASFNHSTPVIQYEGITFTASYDAVEKTLPITYKWDFCGTTKEVTTSTTVYQFPNAGLCEVKLTVDNGYDSAIAPSQTINVEASTNPPTATYTPSPTPVTPTPTKTPTPTPEPGEKIYMYMPYMIKN